MEDNDEDHRGDHDDEDHHGGQEDEDQEEYDDEDVGDFEDGDYGEGEYDPLTGEIIYHTSEFNWSGPSALLRGAIRAPTVKLAECRAKTGEGLGVTRAKVQEKLTKAVADIDYRIFSITNPLHPGRREAFREQSKAWKQLATERRIQQEADARSKAAARMIKAREGQIEALQQGKK